MHRTFAVAALLSFTACVPQYEFNEGTDAAPADAGNADATPPPGAVDAGIDAFRADAEPAPDTGVDAPPPVDAGIDAPPPVDASEAGTVHSWLIAASAGNGNAVDPGTPWEKDTISITRSSTAAKLYLAGNAAGTQQLYVDDNIHIIVTKPGGATVDQYYEFWDGYPCPAASTTPPPNGYMSGWSLPIEVTSMFAGDTTNAQSITVEFWHCAPHGPSHQAFYLVEK